MVAVSVLSLSMIVLLNFEAVLTVQYCFTFDRQTTFLYTFNAPINGVLVAKILFHHFPL